MPTYSKRLDQCSLWVLNLTPAAIPLPPAAWLFGAGLLGLTGVGRRKKTS
ncbi:MAG: VPLPA-CTERM sorting domain-containing protein [Gammaproteobacteria bacterium]|nr:VPLPA-CTERM sorting domain-containing protein [Gammaproteobacteria bacterium]